MARSQALLRVGLAVVLVSGCAGTAGDSVEDATPALVPRAVVPSPSTSLFDPYPSEDGVESGVPSPTAVPDPEFVKTGIDTDQPCTASSVSDGAPAKLGIGLEDVAAMLPGDELRKAVAPDGPGTGLEWAVVVSDDGLDAEAVGDNASLAFRFGRMDWLEGCEAFIRLGRVTGATWEAVSECVTDECPEDGNGDDVEVLGVHRLLASVHLFQTEAGAEAFLEWLAPRMWDAFQAECPRCLDEMDHEQSRGVPELTLLQQGGAKVTRVTGHADFGEAQMALVREGRVVAEVLVAGPPGELPQVDSADLAVAMAAKIAAVPARADPYDITQFMSAPLRAHEFPAWAQDCSTDSGCPPFEFDLDRSGIASNTEFLAEMGGPGIDAGRAAEAAAHIDRFGRSTSYSAHYDLDSGPAVGTSLTQYASTHAARSALEDLASDRMIGGFPARNGDDFGANVQGRFEVPGVEGAVGLTLEIHGEVTTAPHWIVLFPHGPGLARVTVTGSSVSHDRDEGSDDEAAEPWPTQSADGERYAIEVAQEYAARLDRILG